MDRQAGHFSTNDKIKPHTTRDDLQKTTIISKQTKISCELTLRYKTLSWRHMENMAI